MLESLTLGNDIRNLNNLIGAMETLPTPSRVKNMGLVIHDTRHTLDAAGWSLLQSTLMDASRFPFLCSVHVDVHVIGIRQALQLDLSSHIKSIRELMSSLRGKGISVDISGRMGMRCI